MSSVRWSYAVNQWDVNIDTFVRRREHERAFKTISISGFSAVELSAASFGPWEPLGNPKAMADLYGSYEGLREVLASCALEGVSSYVYDPFIGFEVEMGRGHDPLLPSSLEPITDTAAWFSGALQELGGSVLVVRPVGSAWQTGLLDDQQIATLAALWNTVGERIAADGPRARCGFARRRVSCSPRASAPDPCTSPSPTWPGNRSPRSTARTT